MTANHLLTDTFSGTRTKQINGTVL